MKKFYKLMSIGFVIGFSSLVFGAQFNPATQITNYPTYAAFLNKQTQLITADIQAQRSGIPVEHSGLVATGGVFPSSESSFLGSLVWGQPEDSEYIDPLCPAGMGRPTLLAPHVEITYSFRVVPKSESVYQNLKCLDAQVVEFWTGKDPVTGSPACLSRIARSNACWQ